MIGLICEREQVEGSTPIGYEHSYISRLTSLTSRHNRRKENMDLQEDRRSELQNHPVHLVYPCSFIVFANLCIGAYILIPFCLGDFLLCFNPPGTKRLLLFHVLLVQLCLAFFSIFSGSGRIWNRKLRRKRIVEFLFQCPDPLHCLPEQGNQLRLGKLFELQFV